MLIQWKFSKYVIYDGRFYKKRDEKLFKVIKAVKNVFFNKILGFRKFP